MLILEVFSWLAPLVMLPFVARRHTPSAAIAWFIFIFYQPWLGIPLYLIIGENIIVRRQIKTYCQRHLEIRSLEKMRLGSVRRLLGGLNPAAEKLAQLAERLVCMPPLAGNSAELIDDGRVVIRRLVEDIRGANSHVHLLFYIFADDDVGREVSHALVDAAARGVRCRVVVDAFGSRSLNTNLGPWMTQNGVELHTLMPVNPLRRHMTRFDLRNHRKLAVIDGIIAYTGSQNIERKNYRSNSAESWHDLMVRIQGPSVLQLQLVFAEDWYLAVGQALEGAEYFPDPITHGELGIQAIPTGPDESTGALRDMLISAINQAKERLTITSPYFIPDQALGLALHLAALRGVRVDLLLPRHADHPVVGAVARAHFEQLADSGVNIYLHRGLLHSKTMCVDDTLAMIGSANLDRRSFFLHSELGVLLYGPVATGMLTEKQSEYIQQSDPLNQLRWSRRSRLRRIRDDVLKLLSPLL